MLKHIVHFFNVGVAALKFDLRELNITNFLLSAVAKLSINNFIDIKNQLLENKSYNKIIIIYNIKSLSINKAIHFFLYIKNLCDFCPVFLFFFIIFLYLPSKFF
jgi:hypothetical protein